MGINRFAFADDDYKAPAVPMICEWVESHARPHCSRSAEVVIYVFNNPNEERYCRDHAGRRVVQILEAKGELTSRESEDYPGMREFRL